jgi:hypothetical protein
MNERCSTTVEWPRGAHFSRTDGTRAHEEIVWLCTLADRSAVPASQSFGGVDCRTGGGPGFGCCCRCCRAEEIVVTPGSR